MRVNCAATGLAVSAPAAGARPRRLSVTLVMTRIRQIVAPMSRAVVAMKAKIRSRSSSTDPRASRTRNRPIEMTMVGKNLRAQ